MRRQGFRFFFYSNEGAEPPHVHVARDRCEAKYWLAPVEVARNRGFAPHELRRIGAIIVANG
ncbi:DUF4160 domain-containing protein [Paramicrobacterium humi]|uniref:DUF4160 domain-containing protein n=1 Tax=Paramicrobacterium humi TaxID=640635 RepID=UPI000B89CACE|nr:DUF4160 domain-containing protein [Microbacterium humi]